MHKKRLRDLPEKRKPRERLIRFGTAYLTDHELYAILVGSGTKKMDVRSIADQIADKISHGKTNYYSLTAIRGLGKAGACRILAALELGKRKGTGTEKAIVLKQPVDVYTHLAYLSEKRKEYLVGLYLDPQRRLIAESTIATGSIDHLAIEPYDVLFPAVENNTPFIILVHNHPSGDPRPSPADSRLTRQMRKAAELLGLVLLDHVIIGDRSFHSFDLKKTITIE